jgi:energy-converting hydrogenase Eha subunit H
MILYLKGRFLPSDAPGMAEQTLFDRKLIDMGIVDQEGKGPRYAELREIMRQRKARTEQTGRQR